MWFSRHLEMVAANARQEFDLFTGDASKKALKEAPTQAHRPGVC
jgi:hypothetical protein